MADAPKQAPASSSAPDTTPFTARLGLALAAVVIIVLGTLWYDNSRQITALSREIASVKDAERQMQTELSRLRSGAPTAAAAPKPSPAIGKVINVSNAQYKGGDSVVTLVEFSDYECPFCIRHFQQTMPLIEANFIRTNKIRYVFRDYPIDANHPQSFHAHIAAHCAIDQHKFWDLHVRLFSAPGTHQPAMLEKTAGAAGLDVTAFRACIADKGTSYEAAVRASVAEADSLSAAGTPAFFIGMRNRQTNDVTITQFLSGAQPYALFEKALNEAIASAK
jgi:protein-disulfide isomerase